MNPMTATFHRAVQTRIDRYIRSGATARDRADRQLEREICYADHLKAIVDQARRSRPASART